MALQRLEELTEPLQRPNMELYLQIVVLLVGVLIRAALLSGVYITVVARKLEYGSPPTPKPKKEGRAHALTVEKKRKKENQPKSAQIHIPTF